MRLRKIVLAILLVFGVTSPAFAKIGYSEVEHAWDIVTEVADFPRIDITYIKSDTPNAWVMFQSSSNYSVNVTTALMDLLEEEDDIAGVLAHEIGHVKLGHYGNNILRTLGYIALGFVLSNQDELTAAGGVIGLELIEAGFSRGQEVAADDYGTKLITKAGYNPYGLYNAMVCFYNNNYITQPSGFNSHPPSARRIKHIHEFVANLIKKK